MPALRLCFAASLALAWTFAAAASDPSSAQRHTYLVGLSAEPLVDHVAQRVQEQGLAATLGGHKPAMRAAMASSDSADYLRYLDKARTRVLDTGGAALGRSLVPTQVYRYATNGMALRLTAAEAVRLAALPGVTAVRPEHIKHLLTDAGPQWIGADKVWQGQVPGIAANKGDGVVVGVIDTGISPTHPSFAISGDDGHTIVNPRSHYYGLCITGQATCNAKLIGMYDFTSEGTKGVDSVGHGTHVAGIIAGDSMTNSLHGSTASLSRHVSGVAPHANLIMYKACVAKTDTDPDGGCPESALVAAIDQATADQVDVINYSIGGGTEDPYVLLNQGQNDAAQFFRARTAGIVVVAAAGNDGPGPNSLDEPGNAPWVIGVANATHNRTFGNSIGNFSGAANAPPTLNGQGFTSGYGPAPIVYAGNYGNALCGKGDSDYPPTGKSNPFAPGTFHGEIVICDRGIYARVEKGYNVLHAGAGGYILANAAGDGESLISDDHYLPAVHLGYTEGQQLEAWVATPGTHMGTISGVKAVLDDSSGDLLNSSSSRGPYGFQGGVLKPDITAPGTNILSSDYQSSGLALMTGTSMASPSVAGAVALLIGLHPDWSPDKIESALTGTALAGSVREDDGVTLASPLGAGAGRAEVATAVVPGLYLPMSAADLRAQDPAKGGDLSKLNRTGIESESCASQCSFTRTVTDISGGGSWQVSTIATPHASISVTPSQFSLAAGASQTLNIKVDVSDPHLPGSWVNGRIVLHKSTGGQSASDTSLTAAVYATPGAAPAFRQISASGPGGSMSLPLSGLAALPQARFTPTALVPATINNMTLGVDPQPNDLYTTFPGTGKQFVLFPNPGQQDAGGSTYAEVFVVEITGSSAPIANLYAGVDSNGDGQPTQAEQACQSTSSAGSTARCVIDLRSAGAASVWALVDIPQGSGSSYAVTVSSGIPTISGNGDSVSSSAITATGPGQVPANAAFTLQLAWGFPNDFHNPIMPGIRYYGAVLIDGVSGQSVDQLGQIGFMPFALTRSAGADDVADALQPVASRTRVIEPGESLTHQFIDVAGQGTLLLTTQFAAGAQAGNLAFYAVRADFPGPSAAPQIAAAPAAGSGSPQWTLGGASTSKSITVPVNAGRWYIVATNTGSTETTFDLQSQYNAIEVVAPPSRGAYYNPLRSGHGVYMNQGGDQQAVYWYTYLEDGTPIWYGAQTTAPAAGSGAWTAPLMRYTWNGSAINAETIIGDVILTPVSASDYMFSWHLNGISGSEHFVLLGPDQCVDFNGKQAGFTGQWYAPAQSGYGMDVLALPGLQNDTFYFYDSLGQPRWADGNVEVFGPSATVPLMQYTGFCPACNYVPVTTRGIGNLTVNYTDAMHGSYSTNLGLLPPLSGTWNINQPILRLTGRTTCGP